MERILLSVADKGCEFSKAVERLARDNDVDIELVISDSAKDARDAFSKANIDEAWVVSCRDMGAINLASALVQDKKDSHVFAAGEVSGDERDVLKIVSDIEEILPEEELQKKLLAELEARIKEAAHTPSRIEQLEHIELDLDEPDEGLLDIHDRHFPPIAEKASFEAETAAKEKQPVKTPDNANASTSKRSAFVISVMSGSGGVGKSTTVATSAYLAASKGFSVVVLDCDLQFGDMQQLMGDVPCTSVDDILLDEALFKSFARSCNPDLPALVCAPTRLERSEELSGHLDEIIDSCASLFDVVLVNTGSSWSEVNAQLIEKSSCNLFMVDQRASSVRACQHALDLCLRMGMPTGQFIFVLNRCQRGSLFCATDVSNAMDGANVVELKDGGLEVEELLGMGLAGELAASKNDFTNSLNDVLEEVLL